MKLPFESRTEAGRLLAARLNASAQPDLFVMALAPGGVPVAWEIARALNAPVDVLVVHPLRVPCRPQLVVGAVAAGGGCVLDDELVDRLDLETDAIRAMQRQEEPALEESLRLYRGERPPPELAGKHVVLVADTIGCGPAIHAAIVHVHQARPARVVVAAPVMVTQALAALRSVVDDVAYVVAVDEAEMPDACFTDTLCPQADELHRRFLCELPTCSTR